jgi:hypothetical protein
MLEFFGLLLLRHIEFWERGVLRMTRLSRMLIELAISSIGAHARFHQGLWVVSTPALATERRARSCLPHLLQVAFHRSAAWCACSRPCLILSVRHIHFFLSHLTHSSPHCDRARTLPLRPPSHETPSASKNMPFKSGLPGRVLGEGVFENDAALRAVAYLDELAGVDKLTPTATAAGEKIFYSLYATQCSTSEAAEKVRNHLDSGILHTLAAKMVANYFNPLVVSDYTCWGYVPVILGACAMSHGCRTLNSAPGYHMYVRTFKEMLTAIFETAPLMDAAKEQMKKALLGPDGFKSGSAIDFVHFARSPDYTPSDDKDPCISLMIGGYPAGYTPKYKKASGGGQVVIGLCSKGDMGYPEDEKLCGGCENMKHHGKSLLCARCKDQVYCSKACQRKDFRRHKAVCRTAEDRETMKEQRSMWINVLHISANSPAGIPGLSSMAGLAQSLGVPFDVKMGADFMPK